MASSYFLPGELDLDDDDVVFESNTFAEKHRVSNKVLDNLNTAVNVVQNLLEPKKPFAAVGFQKVGSIRFHSRYVDGTVICQHKNAREKLLREREQHVRQELSQCYDRLTNLLWYLNENPNHCKKCTSRSPVIQPTDVWTYNRDQPICYDRKGFICKCSTCRT